MTSATIPPSRGVIKASWYRSGLAGVDPSHALEALTPDGHSHRTPLLEASQPVLEELRANLADTAYASLLVDRECRVVHRICGRRAVATAFDAVGIDLGASLLETRIGTNAPGTALETREAVVIHGEEHFADGLKDFSCYGHPIRNPLTRRVEGVLDISSFSADASPLLRPLLEHAVKDIQRRLQERSRTSDSRIMAAFREAALRSRSALVAFGDDMTVSNRTAQDLLTSSDVAHLRILVEELRGSVSAQTELRLVSGQTARVYADVLDPRCSAALLRIEPQRSKHVTTPLRLPGSPYNGPTLVAGPPGSGRTTRARQIATNTPVTVLNAAAALLNGDQEWALQFRQAMLSPAGTVIIDGIELLSDVLLDILVQQVELDRGPELVMISGPRNLLPVRPAAVAALATSCEETLPLFARRDQILTLAHQMLADMGTNLFLTPAAEAALARHNWPGNLRELRGALEHARGGRQVGAIAVADLPATVTSGRTASAPQRPLHQAERDVIFHVLRTCDGNKAQAAKELGISRTTLYAKMRMYRINEF
ncbi:helix-turn-helix domain-containing protein [Nocardia sp. NPDC004860]|uniref:sigma-54-dependent Fis family transcriptional regulator n=1 Tax=Nocardia sp. NPDC004860 TaxID=3154557 RepID=UPI00339E0BB5